MKQLALPCLFSAFLMLTSDYSSGQGCSDAGFCTSGALQHSAATDSPSRSSLGISLTIGSGEHGITIIIPQVEWKQELARSWNLEMKVPYYFASGNLGTNSGIGDPIVTLTKSWAAGKSWRMFATGGTRISLTDAGATDEHSRPLPMPYQRGLGTTDLILGIGARHRWLFLSAGYQQPLFSYNDNAYSSGTMPLEGAEYNAYFDSRKLGRKGDALLRAEGTYTKKHWAFSGGPLLIYHLGADRVTRISGIEETLTESEGITMNIAARLAYHSKSSLWEIGGGAPFVVRKVRPDGLTRHWVLTLRYELTLH